MSPQNDTHCSLCEARYDEYRRCECRHETPKDKRKCFVATACYGDPNAIEVHILRAWKNDILKKSMFGRILIACYYGGLGQTGAELIEFLPFLKPIGRKLIIDPLVKLIVIV